MTITISLPRSRPVASAVVLLAAGLLPACFDPPSATTTATTFGGSTTALDGTTTDEPLETTGEPGTGTTGSSLDGGSTSPADGTESSSDGGAESSSSDGGAESSSGEPMPVCGDGVLDPTSETCDDGNLMAGDLCDASCQVETVSFAYSGAPQVLSLPAWVGEVSIEAWGAQGEARAAPGRLPRRTAAWGATSRPPCRCRPGPR